MAADTLGQLLALVVTPANEQERARVDALAEQVQAVTEQNVELAYVDQGCTGQSAAAAAAAHGIQLEVFKLADTKRGFVLLPRRWVVERSLAGQISATFTPLRTVAEHPRRVALAGICRPFTQQLVQSQPTK